MKPRCPIALVLFAFLFIASAKAQIGLYAGFSGTHLDSTTTSTIYGPLIGVYAQKPGPLSLGADLRVSFLNHDGAQFNTGAIGPRAAFKLAPLPIKPYAEVLVGIAGYNSGTGSNTTHLNYQILGGFDATVLPRIDWRVIEFDYSSINTSSVSARTLTTGIVFRLP